MTHSGYTARIDFDATIVDCLTDCAEHDIKQPLCLLADLHNATLVASQSAGMSLSQWAGDTLEAASQVQH
jgi:hypothetical protein